MSMDYVGDDFSAVHSYPIHYHRTDWHISDFPTFAFYYVMKINCVRRYGHEYIIKSRDACRQTCVVGMDVNAEGSG